jgi:lysyl-tRNA synthetase, class II
MSSATPPPSSSFDDLIAQRREKLKKFRDAGIDPFPTRFDVTATAAQVKAAAKPAAEPGKAPENAAALSVAGRLMTRRDMGKAAFAHVQDLSGKIQIYLRKDELPAEGAGSYAHFKDHVDLGDILGVSGLPFITKTGEPSLHVQSWRLLSKALRPPPEKFNGMTDVEVRYRRREVDLFSNEESRRRFLQRRRIVSALRAVLDGKDFIEVETPMMQPVPGGATAAPFVTHHEALDMDLYLRIAPELYLKRLLVGGLERVYEIGRSFRNEGIDTRHNPEFSMIEAYQAYTDMRGMMDLTEELIQAAARAVGVEKADYRGQQADVLKPFQRLSMKDLFGKLGLDFAALCAKGGWKQAAEKAGLKLPGDLPEHKYFDNIVDERILPGVRGAAFLFGYPAVFSPLAKASPQEPDIAERFELFICGEEVANAYSEQNDPELQRRHFQEQARKRQAGDAEAMPADEEFLIALEHAMPPAGGLGIGIDRLTMILTGTESIREVILFPLLRPEK